MGGGGGASALGNEGAGGGGGGSGTTPGGTGMANGVRAGDGQVSITSTPDPGCDDPPQPIDPPDPPATDPDDVARPVEASPPFTG